MSLDRDHYSLPTLAPDHAPVVQQDEGIVRWMSGDVYRVVATGESTGGRLGALEADIPPGSGPVLHYHPDVEELFFVLEGEVDFILGDATRRVADGGFVLIPRGMRHRFTNPTSEAARAFIAFTPGGPEAMFVEGGDTPIADSRPEPWPLDRFIALAELAARTGTMVVPPQ